MRERKVEIIESKHHRLLQILQAVRKILKLQLIISERFAFNVAKPSKNPLH